MTINFNRATWLVYLAAMVAAGCGQAPSPNGSPAIEDPAPRWQAANENVSSVPPAPAVTPAAPPPTRSTASSGWKSDWSQVGDVRVRLERVSVERPTMLSFTDKEYLGDNEELVVRVAVENLSKTEPLEYRRWEFGRLSPKLSDNLGKTYMTRTFSTTKVKDGVKGGMATIQPGGPALTDVLLFERPSDEATQLRLSLPPQKAVGDDAHEFVIPASAWKG